MDFQEYLTNSGFTQSHFSQFPVLLISLVFDAMGRNRPSLLEIWEATQVELRGSYSTDRVLGLARYIHDKSWTRVVAVVLGIPLPCLVVTLVIDFVPLSKPSDGIQANKLFLVREFYCFVVMTFLAIHQFRTGVRTVLSYPTKRVVRDTLIVSALTVAVLYGFILVIGFPLPFTTLVVVPAWLTLTLIPMAIQWTKGILENPRAAAMLFDMIKLWLCDFLLAFIYPPYYYVFTSLSGKVQLAFTLLLPVIKLFMRNLFARAVGHLGDETPGLVIFNADVFGSLFVAYCMQSAPSLGSTVVLMIVDIALMGLSLRDIEIARKGLGELERKVDEHVSLDGLMPTTLERVTILLEQEIKSQGEKPRSLRLLELKRVSPVEEQGPQIVGLATTKPKLTVIAVIRNALTPSSQIHPAIGPKGVKRASSTGSRTMSSHDKLKYTRQARRLLYMAEFLLLLNYVEVIIPLVFSIYLIATYHMPNRDYYAIYDGIDQQQLLQTLNNVLVYCSLQFVSLVLLVVVLKRMLGLSPIQQIAFVLEKQVDYIQISLVFWLFYNVQSSLRHLGYDYSFQFAWLSHSPESGSKST